MSLRDSGWGIEDKTPCILISTFFASY